MLDWPRGTLTSLLNSSFLEPNTDKHARLESKHANNENLLSHGEVISLFNSIKVGFNCDTLERFVHRILEECLEEAQVNKYSAGTDAVGCVLGSGIKETAGLLLGAERPRGRQRILSIVDFFPGEEKDGLAVRTGRHVALDCELMELCISKYIPQQFPSGNVGIIGWYHSHPREVTLHDMSAVDKQTQGAYQAMYENAVCLIVRVDLLGRAWLKSLIHSYVLMDEIKKALRFYRVSSRNGVVSIKSDFLRNGVGVSSQAHVYASWFSPLQHQST